MQDPRCVLSSSLSLALGPGFVLVSVKKCLNDSRPARTHLCTIENIAIRKVPLFEFSDILKTGENVVIHCLYKLLGVRTMSIYTNIKNYILLFFFLKCIHSSDRTSDKN